MAFPSMASSVGNRLTESVMEQGLLSGFGIYRTWGPKSGKERGPLTISTQETCEEDGGGELVNLIFYSRTWVSHSEQTFENSAEDTLAFQL